MYGVEKEISRVLEIEEALVISVHLAGEKRQQLFRGEISEDEYWQEVIRENNYPLSVEGYARTLDFLKSAIRRNFRELPGTRRVAQFLRDRGYQLGLLSDHAMEWFAYCEERFPLTQIFHHTFLSYEIGHTKKSTESFLIALERMGANGDRTLFVDDLQSRIDVAREAGIKHVHLFKDAVSFKRALPWFGIDLTVKRV